MRGQNATEVKKSGWRSERPTRRGGVTIQPPRYIPNPVVKEDKCGEYYPTEKGVPVIPLGRTDVDPNGHHRLLDFELADPTPMASQSMSYVWLMLLG